MITLFEWFQNWHSRRCKKRSWTLKNIAVSTLTQWRISAKNICLGKQVCCSHRLVVENESIFPWRLNVRASFHTVSYDGWSFSLLSRLLLFLCQIVLRSFFCSFVRLVNKTCCSRSLRIASSSSSTRCSQLSHARCSSAVKARFGFLPRGAFTRDLESTSDLLASSPFCPGADTFCLELSPVASLYTRSRRAQVLVEMTFRIRFCSSVRLTGRTCCSRSSLIFSSSSWIRSSHFSRTRRSSSLKIFFGFPGGGAFITAIGVKKALMVEYMSAMVISELPWIDEWHVKLIQHSCLQFSVYIGESNLKQKKRKKWDTKVRPTDKSYK